jgi:hypothetical protein
MSSSTKNSDFILAYCLLALLACLPIILFIPRYIDDYGRGVMGYLNWTKTGFRPLAEFLYAAFNLGGPATAVAPLGQILSIPVAGIGALAMYQTFRVQNLALAVAASLPIFFNPYFLENLSYGFDGLSMTAALTLAVLASSQIRAIAQWRSWALICFFLFASLLLYQPAFGAYLPLALTAWLWQSTDRSNDHTHQAPRWWITLSALVSAPAASLILYGLCTKLFWLNQTGYGKSASGLRSPMQFVGELGETLARYLLSLWHNWHNTAFLPIFLLLIIGFIISMAARLSQSTTITYSLIIAAAMPAVLLCIAPGPMFLLSSVSFFEVPRMNAYLGGLFGSLALPIASYSSELPNTSIFRAVSFVVLVAWMWCQIVFSYAYGHAMQAQREYEQSRLTRLLYDISHLDADRTAKFIQFDGSMPASPVLANTNRKFPFMDKLVPRMINGTWTWGGKQMTWYGFKLKVANKNPASSADVARVQTCRNDAVSRCSSEHNILLSGEHLIVKMK